MKYGIKFWSILILLIVNASLFAQSTVIGTTTYDIQTTSAVKKHIQVTADGKISALWTGSTGLAATFTDRGSFYNHFDGTDWGAIPGSRIESVKTSGGEIFVIDDHELMISSDGTKIKVYANSAIGANDWTQTGGSNDIDGFAPMAYNIPGTSFVFVVNVAPGATPALQFSRSTDGGESWDILEYELPYLDTDAGISTILADYFKVAAYGLDVFVLYGAPNTDTKILYSASGGIAGTWLEIPLIDFPIDNYSGGLGQSTDIDADGIADTILTTDGSHELLVTSDGSIYMFSGVTKIYDDNAAIPGWSYLPKTAGIHYWKIGAAGVEQMNTLVDWKNTDGLNDPFAGIGVDYSAYGTDGFTTMPSACYDLLTGTVFVVFTMPVEYTDSYDNPLNPLAQSRSDIFGVYSTDFGTSWSEPVNLTYNAYLNFENSYPSLSDQTYDGKVHMIWQQDNEPGVYTDIPADAIHVNNIVYQAIPISRFDPYVPTPAFTYTLVDLGDGTFNATFTNQSIDAESYVWDFADGDTSHAINPAHLFEEGVFNVCLTATNVYGSNTVCQIIEAVNEPVADFSFSGEPTVAFTDLSTGGITGWHWDFDDASTSTLQNPSHTFITNDVFNVCLTVSNPLGTNTICKDVSVSSILPIADFNWTGDPTVAFTDASLNLPDSWNWSFGDGITSTEENPVHTYATNDNYTVCLTVTNVAGSNSACQTIEIIGYPEIIANFTNTGDPNVVFTDNSINGPFSWFWDFDDGAISTLQNPVHEYAANGTYFVCLTATGPGGTDNFCKFINVANAGGLPDTYFVHSVISGTELQFTDLSTNAPTDWLWEFGDGGISGLKNPTHIFPANGSYNVCLTATNMIGSKEYCENINVTTSINTITASSLKVYPNPAAETVYFTLPEVVTEGCMFEIKTMTNALVIQENIALTGDKFVYNVSALPSGIYAVSISTSNHIYNGLISIQ